MLKFAFAHQSDNLILFIFCVKTLSSKILISDITLVWLACVNYIS